MNLGELLGRYANPHAPPAQVETDFDEVVGQVPPEELGEGVAHAFKSDQTPPFPQMLGSAFGRADPGERAGMLNQLLAAVGPIAASGAVGGLLSRLLGGQAGAAGGPGQIGQYPPQVTAEQAQRISPEQVQEIAAHAQQEQPGVMDRLGSLYARDPALVKKLGAAALVLVLANLAGRRR
jgi:hypothetical protein